MIFLSKWVICRLHVYLPGCNGKMLTLAGAPLLHHHGCPVLSRITAPRPLQGAPPVRSVVKDSYVSSVLGEMETRICQLAGSIAVSWFL